MERKLEMKVAEQRELPWFFLKDYEIPLPTTFASAIGEVVVNWGAFENDIARDMTLMMRFPLVRTLGSEPIRAFKKKIELWKRAVLRLFPDASLYKEIAGALATESKRISDHRNRIIHGQWRTNTDESDPRWIVFLEQGLDRSQIDGFYIDESQVGNLNEEIRTLRVKFVEFAVNRHWHAHLGILCASHEPTPADPAHLILRIDEWPQGTVARLDPTFPERVARTLLSRPKED